MITRPLFCRHGLTLGLLATLLILAVGSSRFSGTQGASAPKEVRMFEVQSSDDLQKLRIEYMKLHDAGYEGRFEVRIAPGSYQPVGWDLQPGSERGSEPRRIDVILRGSPTALPTKLTGIDARSLQLEDLVISGRRSSPLLLQVSQELVMKRCALIGGQWSDPHGGRSYLEIQARGPKKGAREPVKVTIEDSWFVRNSQNAPLSLLSLTAASDDSAYFERADMRRVAFLGNAFDRELAIDFARQLHIEDSLFYRTWPVGGWLNASSTGKLRVEGSAFVVEQLDELVVSKGSPAVAFADSHIYVRSWSPDLEVPDELDIDEDAISGMEGFESREAIVAEATGMSADSLPSKELFAQLREALRPGAKE